MNTPSVLKLFIQYINDNFLLGLLFVISLSYYIYKGFHNGRHSSNKNQQGVPALLAMIFLFLTVLNPLLYPVLSTLSDSGVSYYRFLWIIPTAAISACFLTEIISMISQKKTKSSFVLGSVTALILSAIILNSGATYFTAKNLTFPENKFTISRASLDISQFVHDDPDFTGSTTILAPTEIMMELLAYDVSINPALPRSEYLEYGSGESYTEALLSMVLEGAQRGQGYTAYYLYKLDVDYIVALTNFHLDEYLEQLDYPVYNRTGDYTLYKRSEAFDPFKWMN